MKRITNDEEEWRPCPMRVDRASAPMRIAVVYGRLPVPMTRTDQMTVAHFIEFLSARGHEVDLFSLDEMEGPSREQLDWLKRSCRRVTVFPQGRWRSLLGMARCVPSGLPLQVGWFYNVRQIRAVREALTTGPYDICYVYYLRSAESVRGLGRARNNAGGDDKKPVTVLAMQLSQSLNTRRMAENFDRPLLRFIYTLESRLLRRYEARIWQDFTQTVLIGKKDVEEINRVCREQGVEDIDNCILHPHGVDVRRFTPRPDAEESTPTLVFSGALQINTNANAIRWFVRNVWPLVKRRIPECKLLVVGRRPGPEVRALAGKDGISVEADVPEPADYIARASVCVNPMQAGAGMQNKLIEYMAMGKAIVATSLANEGIGAVAGRDLVIADDPDAMADDIVELLQNRDRRVVLGDNARRLIEREWSWEHHFLKLEEDMTEAMGCRATTRFLRFDRARAHTATQIN